MAAGTNKESRANGAASQLAKLRKTIASLEQQLRRELGASKINQRMLSEAKKARDKVAAEAKSLGAKVKTAVSESTRIKQARDAAVKAANDLKARYEKDRKDLASRAAKVGAELKRRSDELKAAISDSARIKQARDAAVKATNDLKARYEKEKSDLAARLAQTTAEVKRKSEELKNLAQESMHRAAEIVRSSPQSAERPRDIFEDESASSDTDDDDPFDEGGEQ
jgi:chromosome segregation ATPase